MTAKSYVNPLDYIKLNGSPSHLIYLAYNLVQSISDIEKVVIGTVRMIRDEIPKIPLVLLLQD